ILTTTNPLTREQLRQKLIDECNAQGIPYGYFFKDITGGFTITGRTIPNSFNVMPTEVYRIYVDGRADELVRGVDLVGTPLSMFSQIAEAGNDYEVFNGTCGAESGGVPVSSSTPSIFVKRIEMQKKSKSQEKPPILPRPGSIPE
ncbi:MAG: metallopeptidase TldD-related protein, partial [Bacteroidota bacterium]